MALTDLSAVAYCTKKVGPGEEKGDDAWVRLIDSVAVLGCGGAS